MYIPSKPLQMTIWVPVQTATSLDRGSGTSIFDGVHVSAVQVAAVTAGTARPASRSDVAGALDSVKAGSEPRTSVHHVSKLFFGHRTVATWSRPGLFSVTAYTRKESSVSWSAPARPSGMRSSSALTSSVSRARPARESDVPG